MPMNSHPFRMLPVLFFVAVVVVVGLYLGTVLPAAEMLGMRSDALLDLGRHASRYMGGLGISMTLGGGGLLAGLLMRLIVMRVRTGAVPEKERRDAWVAGVCCVLGIAPLLWYAVSWATHRAA
jgi:hypothetical protein